MQQELNETYIVEVGDEDYSEYSWMVFDYCMFSRLIKSSHSGKYRVFNILANPIDMSAMLLKLPNTKLLSKYEV